MSSFDQLQLIIIVANPFTKHQPCFHWHPLILNLFYCWMQSYPHKILTGRRDKMPTLRQTNGLSGFTKRSESEYDCFGTGHSSTSISAALGNMIALALFICCERFENFIMFSFALCFFFLNELRRIVLNSMKFYKICVFFGC